jgi:hypothetical protein
VYGKVYGLYQDKEIMYKAELSASPILIKPIMAEGFIEHKYLL